MKFTVTFSKNQEDMNAAISTVSYHGGLDILDMARRQLELPALDAELVSSTIPGEYINKTSTTIVTTEALAQESGHFEAQTSLHVQMDEAHLREYIDAEARTVRDPKNEAITEVYWKNVVDKFTLFEDWREAGMPVPWILEEKKPEPKLSDFIDVCVHAHFHTDQESTIYWDTKKRRFRAVAASTAFESPSCVKIHQLVRSVSDRDLHPLIETKTQARAILTEFYQDYPEEWEGILAIIEEFEADK